MAKCKIKDCSCPVMGVVDRDSTPRHIKFPRSKVEKGFVIMHDSIYPEDYAEYCYFHKKVMAGLITPTANIHGNKKGN